MPSRLGKWVQVIGERGVRAVQKDNLNNCRDKGPGVATEFVEIDEEAISGGKEMNPLCECLGRARPALLCYAMLSWLWSTALRQIQYVGEQERSNLVRSVDLLSDGEGIRFRK